MALNRNRFAAASALAAAFSLTAPPAAAYDLPLPKSGEAAYDASGDVAQNHRWRRHRRGIDASDVLAGVLILGGIAAVASAAKSRNREYRFRDYPVRDRDYREDTYRYRNDERAYDRSGGIDSAVDMCVGEVERGEERVETIDGANRTGDGWRVTGQLAQGGSFSCWIDNAGRIRDIDIGGSLGYGGYDEEPRELGSAAPGQYDDQTYARAREQQQAEAFPSGWETTPPIDEDVDSAL